MDMACNAHGIDRVFLVVIDSVGCGAAPDAAAFGDEGTDTLGHTAQAAGGLELPMLRSLGLGNIHPVRGVAPVVQPAASWGLMLEVSAGKDTTSGHWELAGLVSKRPFATFPNGFPDEIMRAWLEATGLRGYLGNRSASGTQIIEELGPQHMETGLPIIYTSADSVFQVAAHEELIPPEELCGLCRKARLILDPYRVARIIARPFIGTDKGHFARTYNRHDFSMPPPSPTMLDHLRDAGVEVLGIGKIGDVFSGHGLDRSIRTSGNSDGMARLLELVREIRGPALVFLNLIDFDMLYGHRRDPLGYALALEAFDREIEPVLKELGSRDMLVITADHGCDPTFIETTDHTREQVPLLVLSPGRAGVPLGQRSTFADLAQTITDIFGARPVPAGSSFLSLLEAEPCKP